MGNVFCQDRQTGLQETVARHQNGPIAEALGHGYVHFANRSGKIRRQPLPLAP